MYRGDGNLNYLRLTCLLSFYNSLTRSNCKKMKKLLIEFTGSGGFTIQSTLEIMRNDEVVFTHPKWKFVWKMLVPQRIRFFLWLVFHDRVMTNTFRFVRGLTDDPRCGVCAEVEENIEHILRKCPTAKMVWRKFA